MNQETEKIIDLYSQSLSLRQIAKQISSNHHYVKRVLKKAGITVKSNNKPLVTHPTQCEVCGNTFNATKKTRRFCSNSCRGKAKVLNLFTRFDSVTEIRGCPFCGEDFSCRVKSKQKYCTRKCFDLSHSERMAGINNPSYKNGSSYNKRCFRGETWNTIRQGIYKRDNYSCQRCGVKCIGKDTATPETTHLIIQCHHIKHYESPADNNEANLITLCLRCHATIHQSLDA